jgi:predicted dienelactone hydrolase
MRQPFSFTFALLLWPAMFLAGTRGAAAQLQGAGRATILPTPGGSSPIGRVTYHWIDSTRRDSLAKDSLAPREVMVDVWYPATQTTGDAAPYFPHFSMLRRLLPDSVLRSRFAPGYAAAVTGRLITHATEDAPSRCPQQGCPLLLFSHGGGIDRSLYTAQYEDLASHGYVVAAIAHTYLTHTLLFPDGRVVRLQDRRAIATPSVDSTASFWRRRFGETAATNHFRYAQAAADLRFVLDQVIRYAREPDFRAPFLNQLDLDRIGAVGHSMGGLAVAMACRMETRIRACMNQDGSDDGMPADRDASGRTLSQPFLFFGRVEAPPRPRADSVLARIQMTRAEDDSIRHARPRDQEALLADVAGGAWRLRLRVPQAEHMSFSDEKLIEVAADSVAYRGALQVLSVVHRYTRAFFDRTLRDRRDTPLDRAISADSSLISVERISSR